MPADDPFLVPNPALPAQVIRALSTGIPGNLAVPFVSGFRR
jgi:hypothetical protein